MVPIGGSYPAGNERAIREATGDGKHTPAVCERINSSHDFHTKSHSYRFMCPTCGQSRRQNTNFLGSRYRLVCDGASIKRVHRDDIRDRRDDA